MFGKLTPVDDESPFEIVERKLVVTPPVAAVGVGSEAVRSGYPVVVNVTLDPYDVPALFVAYART